ncbi:MAG: hypothetical protein V4725_09135 [Bacteroidota bacterium]
MKKLFGILAVTAMLASCNDSEETTTSLTDADSTRAAAVADSINAANAMKVDTMSKPMTDTIPVKVDSLGNK